MVAREGSEPGLVNPTSLVRSSEREIVITRTFSGPARIVFDAWTRPELVRRWWAPRALGVSIVSCDADVRVGGRYRYVLKPATEDEFAFSGEYSEITPHSRLVYTAFFEPTGHGPLGDPALVTVTFDERDGRTHVVSRELYPSKEVLDGALATGMESGLRVTMDQLDELVASLGQGDRA
jgi:uncharacterized protein YndB with AHSA1/START domain